MLMAFCSPNETPMILRKKLLIVVAIVAVVFAPLVLSSTLQTCIHQWTTERTVPEVFQVALQLARSI